MTRPATALLGTAFALGISGAAFAQSGMDPATLTCADLAGLGQTEAQGALDMIASNESLAITGATGTSAPATGAATGTSGSGSTGTDTTAGATTGTTGSASSDSSTMAAGSLDQMQIDEIMTACAEAPDRLVSDVYREHSAANQ